jgi:hypothetical protein
MPDGRPLTKTPLTPLRVVFATIAVLLMLFAGGCGLFYIGVGVYQGASNGGGYAMVFVVMGLMLGGIPAAFGYLIWWLSVIRGRAPSVEDDIT